jgi:hypothetical protein
VDKGLHPLDERYVDAYGGCGTFGAEGHSNASPRCPLCLRGLVPTGHNRGGFRYFRHAESEDDECCPLMTTRYQLPGMTVSLGADRSTPEIGLRSRKRFLRHWQRHYRLAREVAPSLTLARFTVLIEYADALNLWSYAALQQGDLPSVLLVLAGFIGARSPGGEAIWERFWFDGSVVDVGDLWNAQRSAPARLFRLVYRVPQHTPLPTAASIVYWEPVRQAVRLAEIGKTRVTRAQARTFAHFLELYETQRAARAPVTAEDEP